MYFFGNCDLLFDLFLFYYYSQLSIDLAQAHTLSILKIAFIYLSITIIECTSATKFSIQKLTLTAIAICKNEVSKV
jgi:hypothetical protein